MTNNTSFLLAALSILCCHHAVAQTATPPKPPQTSTGDQDAFIPSTLIADPESTRVASTIATSVQTNQLEPVSEGLEWGADPTTSRILVTRTMSLTSTINRDTASETSAPTQQPEPLVPVEAVTSIQRPQNTTMTHSSPSTTKSSTSTNTLTSTIYVLQPSPTISQIPGSEATESASWLEKSGVSDPGSKANIAAIGLGAGFGAILLVVVSIMAMWLLHRRGGGKEKEGDRNEDGKLERQSVDR